MRWTGQGMHSRSSSGRRRHRLIGVAVISAVLQPECVLIMGEADLLRGETPPVGIIDIDGGPPGGGRGDRERAVGRSKGCQGEADRVDASR